jgi:IS30 family transposase
MKFRLLNGGLSVDSDTQALERLIKRINTITEAIELFNQSDWKLEEVSMWLQYEKDLALVESSLYTKKQEQQ